MILPLAGGGTVECDDETFDLTPRASVFDGPADMVYIGIGKEYRITGEGRFAICGARAKNSFPNRRVAAADVSVELRGAGNCSRQVHNFGTAGVFEADSLIACEVITPGGNWSSYPAHKHDENTPTRVGARGDLLLRDRAGTRRLPRLRLPPRVRHPRPPDRGARRGPHRRRRAGAARLSRPVGRRTRLPHVLPQRDGRTRRRTRLEDRRRPRTRLAPRYLGRPARGSSTSPAPAASRSLTMVSTAPKRPRRSPTAKPPCDSPSRRPPFGSSAISTSSTTACAPSSSRAPSASSGTATWQASARRCCRTRSPRSSRASEPSLRYVLGRNEQAMVHSAVAYARQKDRLQTWAVTASVGPGSTNMLTGAALATINRLPVLLLPADTFATRASSPGAAGTRTAVLGRRHRQRRVQAGVALLRPGVASRAAARRAARRDAGAHRPRRNRRGHDLHPAGRAGRGPRLAGIPVRRTHLARRASAAGTLGDRARRRDHPHRPQAADRRGGWCHLLRRHRCARSVLREDRHSRRSEPGRQGVTALRPPAVRRRHRLDRDHRGQRARHRGGRRHRNRHPLQRFHQRVANGVQQPRRPLRQRQRGVDRLGQAGRRERRLGRPRGDRGTRRRAWRLLGERRIPHPRPPNSLRSGTTPSLPCTSSTTVPHSTRTR